MRRALLVASIVALGAALTIYLSHGWFHRNFGPAPIADAIGAALLVLIAFAAQRLVSLAFYRDHMLGMNQVTARQDDTLDSFHQAAEEVSNELRQVADYNEIIRGQLKNVIDGTEKAACCIVERLQAIDQVVTGLDRFVAGTSDETAALYTKSEERIAHNQRVVSQMGEYVQQRVHDAERDQVRVAQVVQEARSLESLVQLIKNIAAQTNLLSLNAAIEAARAGPAGRGFAVVADEVRKLSNETESAVVKISQGIESVADNIERQFQEKLSSINLDKVSNGSAQIASMFCEAQANVQFQDVCRQQVEQVTHALKQLDEHASLLADRLRIHEHAGVAFMPITHRMEALYSRYVMEQQRVTHAGVSDSQRERSTAPARSDSSQASPRVELF